MSPPSRPYLLRSAQLHPGKVHLHLGPVFNAINGLVAFVETHHPVRFPLRALERRQN